MFEDAIEAIGKAADGVGVGVIVVGVLVAAVMALGDLRRGSAEAAYSVLRQRVGRAILIGLEVLVAADIIRTVAVSPTLEGVGVLAIIVVIRTVLSFSLEVELEGRWPWQQHPTGVTPVEAR